MALPSLTAARLRELVHYDPETGVFTRVLRIGKRGRVGDILGSNAGGGYLQVGVNGRAFYAHRLAWLYMTGEWPQNHIDHIDGERTNNRFTNLRDVECRVNLENTRPSSRPNRSGLMGARKHPLADRWTAEICSRGQRRYLGIFKTPEEAHAAYLSAKRELHEGNTL